VQETLLIARLDRLARNVPSIATLMESGAAFALMASLRGQGKALRAIADLNQLSIRPVRPPPYLR
jgi:hypothetical protein